AVVSSSHGERSRCSQAHDRGLGTQATDRSVAVRVAGGCTLRRRFASGTKIGGRWGYPDRFGPGRTLWMGYPFRFEVADSRQVPWLSCRLEEWVRRFGASLPMRMTASWFRSLDLPHTRLWRDSTAPESGLPSDCHPDCIIVLEAVRMRPGEIEPRT